MCRPSFLILKVSFQNGQRGIENLYYIENTVTTNSPPTPLTHTDTEVKREKHTEGGTGAWAEQSRVTHTSLPVKAEDGGRENEDRCFKERFRVLLLDWKGKYFTDVSAAANGFLAFVCLFNGENKTQKKGTSLCSIKQSYPFGAGLRYRGDVFYLCSVQAQGGKGRAFAIRAVN